MDDATVDSDLDIVDFRRGFTPSQKEKIVPVATVPSELINSAREAFIYYGQNANGEVEHSEMMPDACTVYEHKDFDGPSYLPALRRGC
jgi:alkylated DNA repair protein alkB family protein 1